MERKTNWKELRDRLAEWEADPEGLLTYLVALRSRCSAGIWSQKPVGGRGVEDVLEVYPALELAVTKEIRSVAEDIRRKAEDQETSRDLDITVTVALPDDLCT